jgi:hypothetical protein
MNECYSGPTKGSAVQTRGKPPASPGQPSSWGLSHQNISKIQRNVALAHLPNTQMRKIGWPYQRGEGPTLRGWWSWDKAELGGFCHQGLPKHSELRPPKQHEGPVPVAAGTRGLGSPTKALKRGGSE